MAKDKIAKAFLAITKDKFTIDTIAEMIATKHLAEGDIVRLNGYYSAGDGAGHKRKIEATDDGSGVQLANGLWANIVHDGEVNVSWFGAKGDGVADDTVAIQKAFNIREVVVNLDNRRFVISSSINFWGYNKHIKGSGATILMKGVSTRINIKTYPNRISCKIENITFETTDSEIAIYSYSPLENNKATWGSKLVVERCYFKGFSKLAIKLNKANVSRIIGCDFYGTESVTYDETRWTTPSGLSSSIQIAGGFGEENMDGDYSFSNVVKVESCRFYNNNICVDVKSAHNVSLDNCVFENSSIGVSFVGVTNETGYFGKYGVCGVFMQNCWFERLNRYISGDLLNYTTGAINNPSWVKQGEIKGMINNHYHNLYSRNTLNTAYIEKKSIDATDSKVINLVNQNLAPISNNTQTSTFAIRSGFVTGIFKLYSESVTTRINEQICFKLPILDSKLDSNSTVNVTFHNKGVAPKGVDILGVYDNTYKVVRLYYKGIDNYAIKPLTMNYWANLDGGGSITSQNPLFFELALSVML